MSRARCSPVLFCILQLLFLTAIFGLPGKDPGKHRDVSGRKDSLAHASLGSNLNHLPHYSKALIPRSRVESGDLGLQRDHKKFGVYPNPLPLHKRTEPNKRPVDSDSDGETQRPPLKQPKNQDDPGSRLYNDAIGKGQVSSQTFEFYRLRAEYGGAVDKEPLPTYIKKIALKERNPQEAFDCVGQEVLTVFKSLQNVIKDPSKKCRPADYMFSSGSSGRSGRVEIDVSLHNRYIGVNFEKFGTRDYNLWEQNTLQINKYMPTVWYQAYSFWTLATKFDAVQEPLRYIAFYNIRNPNTIKIVLEAHQRAKLPDGLNYLRVTSSANQDTLEAEIWTAVKGTDEVFACEEFLYSHVAEFGFARMKELYTYVSSAPDGGEVVSILVGVKGRSESPQSPKPTRPGDVSQIIQELEGNGERLNILKPIYDRAVEKGKQTKEALEGAEITALSLMLSDHDFHPLEHSSPFPQKYEIDYSWSGLQTYAFEGLLVRLALQDRSLGVFESTSGTDESQRGQIVQNKHSYRKVNVNEIVPSHKPPVILRLITSSSAENKHFSFRWPWEKSVYSEGGLHHLLYHCWRIGSNDHDEPNSLYPSAFKDMRYYAAIPAVPLKYITIWGIEEPITLIVLRLIYISWGKSEEKFSLTHSELEDDSEKENWNAIIGTPALSSIADMCTSYMTGLRSCNIAAIHFSFHRPLSVSEKVLTWSSNSVSIVVELSVNIKEEFLHLDTGRKTSQINKAWDRVRSFGIFPGEEEDEPDIATYPNWPNVGAAGFSEDREDDGLNDFPMALTEIQTELERTKLDLSYSVTGYPSFSIIENPFLPTLSQRVYYTPSGGPSYTRMETTQTFQNGAELYRILYQTALSSQEEHLLLVDYQVKKKMNEKGKGKAKAAGDNRAAGDDDFAPSTLDPDAEEFVKINLGTVLFATWFSQEGWSRISRITFQTVHPNTIPALEVLLDEANPVVVWERDTPESWDQNLESFYTTMEGGVVRYFIEKQGEFLTNPTIETIHIGLHIGDTNKHFVYVDFGDHGSDFGASRLETSELTPEPDSSYPSLYIHSWQPIFASPHATALEKSFLKGAMTYADERTRYISDRDKRPHGYIYNDKKDRNHLQKYEFQKDSKHFDNAGQNHITIHLRDKGLLRGISILFYGKHATQSGFRDTLFLEYSTWTVHLRQPAQNNMRFVFATSGLIANLVLVAVDPSEQGSRANVDTALHLADAMYATWINADHVDGHEKTPWTPLYGINSLTVLKVLPESASLLEQIYGQYSDLVSNKTLTIGYPRLGGYRRRILDAYTPEAQIGKRMERLWVSLLALTEISALSRMIIKFRDQMNRDKWGHLLFIDTIVIRRTEEEDGAAYFQMFIVLDFTRGKPTKDIVPPASRTLSRGDGLVTFTYLDGVGGIQDGEPDLDLFDTHQIPQEAKALDVLHEARKWIRAIKLQSQPDEEPPTKISKLNRIDLPELDLDLAEKCSIMHILTKSEDMACRVVSGYYSPLRAQREGRDRAGFLVLRELNGFDSGYSDSTFHRQVNALSDMLFIAFRDGLERDEQPELRDILFEVVSENTARAFRTAIQEFSIPPYIVAEKGGLYYWEDNELLA
ncbi:hypothetical protein TWF106_005374 [Orbilia oligospora]|uniref:Uncharacterized protein n=1 Tax=Orbilia oligospora TaxID=2813651 RepID=A0A7C8Q6J8_ORBOL|nr:hypothetical protein TWF106_005374 [Orbilia oligospora]